MQKPFRSVCMSVEFVIPDLSANPSPCRDGQAVEKMNDEVQFGADCHIAFQEVSSGSSRLFNVRNRTSSGGAGFLFHLVNEVVVSA